MADLTPDRLQELRRIAEAATPGPWRMHSEPEFSGPWSVGADHLPGSTVATAWAIEWSAEAAQTNAQHIAAFDPTTCLALLDRIEALEQERDAALGEVEKLRSVIRDLLPIAEARVAWEEEYESDALSSTSWIEPKTRVIARAKEVLGDDTGGATHA